MKHLVLKELTLSINKFYYILPILLGALMLIPGWIYLLVFMYFFWISVPQIFAAYNTNADYNFISTLPVRRKDIVTAKALTIFILEAIHILFALLFGLLHNVIYQSSWNLFFDINLAFFGVGILMYGLFNVVFLPVYFKTAHFFGKATIYGAIATLIYGFIFEYGVFQFQLMRDIFEGSMISQMIPFAITCILGIGLSWYAVKRSQANFIKIDL